MALITLALVSFCPCLTLQVSFLTALQWLSKPASGYWIASLMIDSKCMVHSFVRHNRSANGTSPVYSNSLLATLNSRPDMRAALNNPVSIELSTSRSYSKKNSPQTTGGGGSGQPGGSRSFRSASPLGSLSFTKRGDLGDHDRTWASDPQGRSLGVDTHMDSVDQDLYRRDVYDG
jgi:hypothetical protein